MARSAWQVRRHFGAIAGRAVILLLLLGNITSLAINTQPDLTHGQAGAALSIWTSEGACTSSDASAPDRNHHHDYAQCCIYCISLRRIFAFEFSALLIACLVFFAPRLASFLSLFPFDEFEERAFPIARSHQSRAPPVIS